LFLFFFFSSRRRHTRSDRDWSSDVCSSDLVQILLERIHRRARDFEQRIPPAYLQQLNERYAEWVERFRLCPILTVDAERLDLAHLDSLVAEMQARLPSLFPLIER